MRLKLIINGILKYTFTPLLFITLSYVSIYTVMVVEESKVVSTILKNAYEENKPLYIEEICNIYGCTGIVYNDQLYIINTRILPYIDDIHFVTYELFNTVFYIFSTPPYINIGFDLETIVKNNYDDLMLIMAPPFPINEVMYIILITMVLIILYQSIHVVVEQHKERKKTLLYSSIRESGLLTTTLARVVEKLSHEMYNPLQVMYMYMRTTDIDIDQRLMVFEETIINIKRTIDDIKQTTENIEISQESSVGELMDKVYSINKLWFIKRFSIDIDERLYLKKFIPSGSFNNNVLFLLFFRVITLLTEATGFQEIAVVDSGKNVLSVVINSGSVLDNEGLKKEINKIGEFLRLYGADFSIGDFDGVMTINFHLEMDTVEIY